MESISPAKLCRKHNQVDPNLLQQVLERLAMQILSRHGCSIADRKALRIIDSTTVALCLRRYKWADFRKNKAGIKLHLRLAFSDAHEVLPEAGRFHAKRMKHKLRMMATTDSQGDFLILLTNRFDLSCDEISEMYRSRRAIETLLKWMKQHLKIKHFYGTSKQAVHNQVWRTLIAFCLLMLAKRDANVEHSLLQIQRWLKALIWKPYAQWIGRMKRRPSRKSAGRKRLEPT
ncbi:transposase [Paenibacillus dendritiformis]|uniref:transposase n=1 Tax=Paenibacillus dendritiformis TaxID=130049 RepID=UPI0015EB5DAC|nr:transposase [Paenibacillus dendritiformis]